MCIYAHTTLSGGAKKCTCLNTWNQGVIGRNLIFLVKRQELV